VRIRRVLPTVIVILLGAVVALALAKQFQARPATPSPVPAGDHEIAWIHTTTSPQTWERLVAAVFQIRREFPAVKVDDSRAFLDQTAAVPEVVLSVPGRQDKIRLRWYKLSSEVGNQEWVDALASRNPAPLAFMGGGSSDRAIELAQALDQRTEWKGGARPLLFITTATANSVIDPDTGHPKSMLRLYPGRTFRGCFTNEAMARAVIDFVWQAEDLQPRTEHGRAARAYVMAWQDDPYSVDLADQFVARIQEQEGKADKNGKRVSVHPLLDRIAYSVGTFTEPNPPEREVMDRIVPELASHPDDRAILVLPAVSQPARRIIRAFAADSPLIGQRLVAVTGDGVSFNLLFRDGDVAWPVQELSIPLVFFAHQNPVAWNPDDAAPDTGSLQRLTATDDVLLFADIIREIAVGVYMGEKVTDADKLLTKLRTPSPLSGEMFFTEDGERRTGKGEHIVVLRPQFREGGRVDREAAYEVYARQKGQWKPIQRLVK